MGRLTGIDTVLLDLDGTLYVGSQVVPGGPETVRWLRDQGLTVRFTTNTDSITPAALEDRLTRFGFETSASSWWPRRRFCSRVCPAIAILALRPWLSRASAVAAPSAGHGQPPPGCRRTARCGAKPRGQLLNHHRGVRRLVGDDLDRSDLGRGDRPLKAPPRSPGVATRGHHTSITCPT